jgi:hypothetical protein
MEGISGIALRACGLLAASTLIVLGLESCGPHDQLPFPDYAPKATSQVPATGSNAYQDYALAAADFDKRFGARADKLTAKPTYSEPERIGLQKQTREEIQRLHSAVLKTCTMPVDGSVSKDALKGRAEWRVLGEVLRWNIQDACQNENYSEAVRNAVIATKFGFDLTGGSPSDASLGFAIVDETRRTIAPFLTKLNPVQLSKLSGETKKIFLNRPQTDVLMQRVAEDMLQHVQEVQNAYRDRQYDQLARELGDDAKEPIEYLRDLHDQSDKKRYQFFETFATEAKVVGSRLVANSRLPLAERTPLEPVKSIESQPWKRFAIRFFHDGDPLLAMNDATEARTQMLILECQIQISLKTEEHTPRDLAKFTKRLTVDPYSGELLVYHTDGRDYKLYSVGQNLKDDAGGPDGRLPLPDVALEVAS